MTDHPRCEPVRGPAEKAHRHTTGDGWSTSCSTLSIAGGAAQGLAWRGPPQRFMQWAAQWRSTSARRRCVSPAS
jgi:hypothetical protein